MSTFASFWDTFVKFGLEAFGRYYSVYRAKCSDNADPKNQGRIRVVVEALGRTNALAEWAYPITPFGSKGAAVFFPPEPDDQVYVMFENGNPRLPMYLGGWWMPGNLPSSFQKNPPTVRGIETKSGHKILFDEGSSTPGIQIETQQGHKVVLDDSSGSLGVKLETAAGAIVKLNDTDQTITIAKQEGAPPLIQINAAGQIMLFSPFAAQAFVLGTQFINDYLQHTHPDPQGGATGPPSPNGLYTSFNIFGQ
jgi:hypothetical protein